MERGVLRSLLSGAGCDVFPDSQWLLHDNRIGSPKKPLPQLEDRLDPHRSAVLVVQSLTCSPAARPDPKDHPNQTPGTALAVPGV